MKTTQPRTARLILTLAAVGVLLVSCGKKPAANAANNVAVRAATPEAGFTDCMISDEDVVDTLGTELNHIGKADFRLGLSETEKADPKVKACGLATPQGAYIYWQAKEFVNDQAAEQAYKEVNERFIKTAREEDGDYTQDELRAITGGGFMTRSFRAGFERMYISARVEKITFQLRSSSQIKNRISPVLLKGLAVGISRSLPTTPR